MLVAVIVAVFAGLCGYDEARKVEGRFRTGPWEVTPAAWGALSFAGVLAVGLILPLVAFAGVVTFVGYRGATRYEAHYRKRLGGLVAPAWGGICGVGVFVGALVTSTFITATACVVFGLVLALVLTTMERDALARDNDALVREKDALIAEKRGSRTETSAEPASARAGSGAYSNAVAAALRGEEPPAQTQRPGTRPARSVASRWSASGANTHDLVPRSARRREQGTGGSDLLPGGR